MFKGMVGGLSMCEALGRPAKGFCGFGATLPTPLIQYSTPGKEADSGRASPTHFDLGSRSQCSTCAVASKVPYRTP